MRAVSWSSAIRRRAYPGSDGSVLAGSDQYAARRPDREAIRAGTGPAPAAALELGGVAEQPADPDLSDGLQSARRRVIAATERLAEALERAADGLAHLDVATYSSPEPARGPVDTVATGARLLMRTRCGLAGDVATVLAEPDGAVDAEVRALHLDLLKQARAARAELLAALGPALRNLLDALGRS